MPHDSSSDARTLISSPSPVCTSWSNSQPRLSRAQLVDILQYTPHVPSICCAAAHPNLRYAREIVTSTRANHGVHRRGNLHVRWDWKTERAYHSLSGKEDELAQDLKMLAWWLTRPFLDNGDPMILEVNVKQKAPSSVGTEPAKTHLEDILHVLTTPPYQQVEAGVSCLRSLIFTSRQLEVTPAVVDRIGQLTHLEKIECFSNCLALPLPGAPSVYVLKLRNLNILTDITPLLPLSRLRKLSLCRCSELHSTAALAALPELTEVRLANCRQLDLQGNYAACRQLTSFSMRWCAEVLHVEALATLPNLRELDCSYCGLHDVENLVRCAELRRFSLRGCQTAHELFSVIPDAARHMKTATNATPSSRSYADEDTSSHTLFFPSAMNASRSTSLSPLISTLWQLEELDVGESSLTSLAGVAQVAPRLEHLTVQECNDLHSLSPLGRLFTLTSIDASFSGVHDLQGLWESPSLEYVNLTSCPELRSVAPLAKVRSLREVDLSVQHHTCILCFDDVEDPQSNRSTTVHHRHLGDDNTVLRVMRPPQQPEASDELQNRTMVMQRSHLTGFPHRVSRKDAETLLSQPLSDLRVCEASTVTTVW